MSLVDTCADARVTDESAQLLAAVVGPPFAHSPLSRVSIWHRKLHYRVQNILKWPDPGPDQNERDHDRELPTVIVITACAPISRHHAFDPEQRISSALFVGLSLGMWLQWRRRW